MILCWIVCDMCIRGTHMKRGFCYSGKVMIATIGRHNDLYYKMIQSCFWTKQCFGKACTSYYLFWDSKWGYFRVCKCTCNTTILTDRCFCSFCARSNFGTNKQCLNIIFVCIINTCKVLGVQKVWLLMLCKNFHIYCIPMNQKVVCFM